jgi:hypothetical protein
LEYVFGCELHADGSFAFGVELVLGEAAEDVGLAHSGVADQHYFVEHVVLLLVFVHPHK